MTLDTLDLPPDRADSRGLLTHLNGQLPRAGYGSWLVSASVTLTAAAPVLTLRLEVSGPSAAGLILYVRNQRLQ